MIAGGFGILGPAAADGEHHEITAQATAEILTNASSLVITPAIPGSASTPSPDACPAT